MNQYLYIETDAVDGSVMEKIFISANDHNDAITQVVNQLDYDETDKPEIIKDMLTKGEVGGPYNDWYHRTEEVNYHLLEI